MDKQFYIYLAIMSLITYAIRAIPLVFINKKISNPTIQSFLDYIPYTVLAAMTFPAILSATASVVSAVAGFIVALIAAYREKSLLTVALWACAAVFIVERIMAFAA